MGTRRAGDEIDFGDLEELPEDQLSSPVSVDESGSDPLLGELLDGLGDVGSLHRDRVLDSRFEKVEDIGPALDDDDGFGVLDVGSCGAPVLSVGGDLLHLDALPHAVHEVVAGTFRLLDEVVEELFGALDDLLPLGDPDVFDAEDVDGSFARSDAIDGLESGSEDDGLHLVEAGGHVDDAFRFSAFRDDLHLDPSDPAGFLKDPEVEIIAEEPFGLSEDCPYDVGILDNPVRVDLSSNHVLCRVWIDIHVDPPKGLRKRI